MFEKRQKPLSRFLKSTLKLLFLLAALYYAQQQGAKLFPQLNQNIYEKLAHLLVGTNEVRLGDEKDHIQKIAYQEERIRYEYPETLSLQLDQEARRRTLLTQDDYSPQEIAVYIHQLKDAGIEAVGLSSPLHWEVAKDDIGIQALGLCFPLPSNYLLGMRGQTSAIAEFTPLSIQSLRFDAQNIEGDKSGLAQANRSMPNSLQNKEDIAWCPDLVVGDLAMEQSFADSSSYPLILKWNGDIYPTLPLQLAMQQMGLDQKDIFIHIGQYIQVGDRRLAMDDTGRIPLEGAKTRDIPLEHFLDGRTQSYMQGKSIFVEHRAQGQQSSKTRLEKMARTHSILTARQEKESHTLYKDERVIVLKAFSYQAHQKAHWLLYALLLLWTLLLPCFTRAKAYGITLVSFGLSSALLLWYSYAQGLWVNWASILATGLCLLILLPLRWAKKKRAA